MYIYIYICIYIYVGSHFDSPADQDFKSYGTIEGAWCSMESPPNKETQIPRTNSNLTMISVWICTARYQGI